MLEWVEQRNTEIAIGCSGSSYKITPLFSYYTLSIMNEYSETTGGYTGVDIEILKDVAERVELEEIKAGNKYNASDSPQGDKGGFSDIVVKW